MKVRTTADLEADEIADSLSREEVMNFIIALDAALADYEFTEELSGRLLESLANCTDDQEPFDIKSVAPVKGRNGKWVRPKYRQSVSES